MVAVSFNLMSIMAWVFAAYRDRLRLSTLVFLFVLIDQNACTERNSTATTFSTFVQFNPSCRKIFRSLIIQACWRHATNVKNKSQMSNKFDGGMSSAAMIACLAFSRKNPFDRRLEQIPDQRNAWYESRHYNACTKLRNVHTETS